MNISEEKRFLYTMMTDTMAERRKLTEIYYDLKKRLDELNSFERMGLDEIPIKEYIEGLNRRNTSNAVENIRKVAEHSIQRVEKEAEEKINPPEVPLIPKAEIELEKEKISKNKPSRTTGTVSVDKAAGMIAHVLKEHGIPMTVANLYEAVNAMSDIPITRNNFRNNMLPRSMKVNRNIDNISRGYYQYLSK